MSKKLRTPVPAYQKSIPGIMGGMSLESSNHFEADIQSFYRQYFPYSTRDKIKLDYKSENLDMKKIEEQQKTAAGMNEWCNDMIAAALRLRGKGADFIAVISNTAHKFANEIQAAAGIPLMHIATPAISAIKADKIDAIGLIGTRYTMTERYLIDLFENSGIKVIVPNAEDIEYIHDITFSELINGIIEPESRKIFEIAMKDMQSRGAQGIVYGCTEDGLLVPAEPDGYYYMDKKPGVPLDDDDNKSIRAYDTTDLFARAVAMAAYYGYDAWQKSLQK